MADGRYLWPLSMLAIKGMKIVVRAYNLGNSDAFHLNEVEFRFDKLENYSPINCNVVILFPRYIREIVTIFKIEL